ncbi:MAG: CoA-binding protein [Spirochaetota bacterium]|nr:CoA-binding protein [Spirochaetota bacterium]
MHQQGVTKFKKYFVGINSLAEVATKEDKVCVLNILGSESRSVTPVSHAFSGGNVAFGTSPGRSGQSLPTPIGNIPVYNNVAEGLEAGHKFNTAVIYLPPSGVRDGVAEVVRVNPELKKIIILTEKVSVKDARIIRAIGQLNGIDIFGANCLGVADSYNKIRIGGALGGSNPAESLVPGSVAIFSNSGNFTTTIAVYLLSKGWGTTTSVSSGKDVYIHFSAHEFINAFENDPRSKSAVMYIEPGGYYEHGLEFKKPIVACVVGRWKARLTKAVGHAGSLAGSGDDALAKEKWFMDYFGVKEIYTPENPIFSKKGAVVTNIAHIPEAMTRVMEANGAKADFEPKGDLSMKAWFGNNQGLSLPKELDSPIVEAVSPYNDQITTVNKQIGMVFPRQSMKDTSGASMMDPVTQVTRVHNVSILDSTKHSIEENLVMAIIREYPDETGTKLANIAFNAYVNLHNEPALHAAEASRKTGNSPNISLSSAVGIVGKKCVEKAQKIVEALVEIFQYAGITDPIDSKIDYKNLLKNANKETFFPNSSDRERNRAQIMMKAIDQIKKKSIFVNFVVDLAKQEGKELGSDVLLAAITTTLSWSALMRKRISKITLTNLPWYFMLYSTLVGASVKLESHTADSLVGISNEQLVSSWGFGEIAFLSLIGRRPNEEELFAFSVLIGLIISNGPGTISAQGSKGAVSSDGPENPSRVQINKAFMGFMTHTGYAHGGNGYEAMAFLLDQFKNSGLKDPGNKNHNIKLNDITMKYAQDYNKYKKNQKAVGNITYSKIPCVNHPVFKGKDVNFDPREVFVRELFDKKGSYNIFLDFYHELVNALFKAGVSNNVYCVNVDAVIAVILLKILWIPYTEGKFKEEDLESSAFTAFLFGRMIGCAAEIEDHINRGRDMDTRTPASQCFYVN